MMSRETQATDYVLGTENDELMRLQRQHQVWRKHCLDVWKRAGIERGSQVIDVGAGPGFASFDLAQIVGPSGRIVALERSQNFLNFLNTRRQEDALGHLDVYANDLMKDEFPVKEFDATWCRWVCTFLQDPNVVVRKIHGALRSSGIAVFHEYVNYDSWRMVPHVPAVVEFVDRVKATWTAERCEANVAPKVVQSLLDVGFSIKEMRPLHFCAKPREEYWVWLTDYMRVNTQRLLERGELATADARRLLSALEQSELSGEGFMLTPTVLEVIAVKP